MSRSGADRSQLKTRPTKVSVQSYLDAIKDDGRREDCEAITTLMKKVTKCDPVMWGPSIVGFDTYHYRYESGREGDMCIVGFSSRTPDLVIYLMHCLDSADDLLADLGKHKHGKACLYIKRLADVKLSVLKQLVTRSIRETRKRYP